MKNKSILEKWQDYLLFKRSCKMQSSQAEEGYTTILSREDLARNNYLWELFQIQGEGERFPSAYMKP